MTLDIEIDGEHCVDMIFFWNDHESLIGPLSRLSVLGRKGIKVKMSMNGEIDSRLKVKRAHYGYEMEYFRKRFNVDDLREKWDIEMTIYTKL